MIDFSDVRRESEPTFVFFARQLRSSLEYALQTCQITGWQIMTKKEAQQYLPDDFTIPEVRISPGAPRVEKNVLAFVSHFNAEDMGQKIQELRSDLDIINWQNDRAKRAYEAYEEWMG